MATNEKHERNAFTLNLIQAVVMLDYGCVGAMRTVLPFYSKSLGSAATGVGALETVYGLGQVAGALLLGKLSDRRGRKVVLLLSFTGSAVGYGMAAFAVSTGSTSLLLLSRLPVGLAKQTITASRSIISDVTSHADRTSVMARLFSSMALGYACGPVLGGVLLDRSALVALYAALRLEPSTSRPAHHTLLLYSRGRRHLAQPCALCTLLDYPCTYAIWRSPALLCAMVFVLLIPAVALLLPETRATTAAAAAAAAAEPDGAELRPAPAPTPAPAPAPTPAPAPAPAPAAQPGAVEAYIQKAQAGTLTGLHGAQRGFEHDKKVYSGQFLMRFQVRAPPAQRVRTHRL